MLGYYLIEANCNVIRRSESKKRNDAILGDFENENGKSSCGESRIIQ